MAWFKSHSSLYEAARVPSWLAKITVGHTSFVLSILTSKLKCEHKKMTVDIGTFLNTHTLERFPFHFISFHLFSLVANRVGVTGIVGGDPCG